MTKARHTSLNPASREGSTFCGLENMRHDFEEDKFRLGCSSVPN